MTNQQFIADCAQDRYTRSKSNSSLYFDGKHVYSYGTHYPLLVRVGDSWILNDTGYSVTTAKHISLAWKWSDYRMSISNGATEPKELLEQAKNELRVLISDLAALSSRAWKKRETLEERKEQVTRTYAFLKARVTHDQGNTIAALTF